ncbi:hypothetical protein NE237_032853 [Protea cynaroides]|uniref:Uncharacterized protein n=1 Tax=Protea cynaroides TaxID=273540 RepID=A0A9Q0L4A6_9MAGN|nr:hypothetical protein NE237_032853 [Protea cynaroides]
MSTWNWIVGVREKLRNAEIRSGASFGALLRSALSAGIISRRRVYFETITYEREHNAGFSLPFRYSVATVVAATNAVFLMERLSVEVVLDFGVEKLIKQRRKIFC